MSDWPICSGDSIVDTEQPENNVSPADQIRSDAQQSLNAESLSRKPSQLIMPSATGVIALRHSETEHAGE